MGKKNKSKTLKTKKNVDVKISSQNIKTTSSDSQYIVPNLNKDDKNVMIDSLTKDLPADIPKEAKEKLNHIKKILDEFQKKTVNKFQGYIMGISLLPPAAPASGKKLTDEEKKAINVLVLIDDADSKKMSRDDLRKKLSTIMQSTATEIDSSLKIETVLIDDLWQSCFDGKLELLKKIALSAPVFDRGMLSAIKIAEIHKQMVLEKFENYIVSYVLAGSLVQGKATAKSDIDVFIVIDDTDVKKMSRAELKDKLRAIIIGMGVDAGNMTGIKNKINIQVYILTDFWDSIKEANPVIFTFLRDGVPFYDRGIFMPWKQLLKMGKIKPSPEAIDMYMHSGDQMLERVKLKLKEIGMEDFFWATLTPSQAALMMMGVAPPTPKESPKVMRDVFVKKEKLLESEYVDILEKIIKTRKDMEHGDKTTITGKEIDLIFKDAEKYLKRLKKLFNQISEVQHEKTLLHIYDSVVTMMRDILKLDKDIKSAPKSQILKMFEDEIVHSGLIDEKTFSSIEKIFRFKKAFDNKKITKHDLHETIKHGGDTIKKLLEHVERKKAKELDRIKLKVKYGNKIGEVLLLGSKVFIIHDINTRDRISVATINKAGRFVDYQDSTLEDMEQELSKLKLPKNSFIQEQIFEDLRALFGKNVEILLNN